MLASATALNQYIVVFVWINIFTRKQWDDEDSHHFLTVQMQSIYRTDSYHDEHREEPKWIETSM